MTYNRNAISVEERVVRDLLDKKSRYAHIPQIVLDLQCAFMLLLGHNTRGCHRHNILSNCTATQYYHTYVRT